MSDAPPSPRRMKDRVVAMLVGQALDDLEAEHIDIATALRLVAELAWVEAYRVGLNARDFPKAPTEPPRGHTLERCES